jgi:hypothetical protein
MSLVTVILILPTCLRGIIGWTKFFATPLYLLTLTCNRHALSVLVRVRLRRIYLPARLVRQVRVFLRELEGLVLSVPTAITTPSSPMTNVLAYHRYCVV